MRSVTILGATGSVGTSALDVIARHPERYRVHALTAQSNVEQLADLAQRFRPDVVVIGERSLEGALHEAVRTRLKELDRRERLLERRERELNLLRDRVNRHAAAGQFVAGSQAMQDVLELAARVNQLEREADRVHQDAIVALFDEERDPIAVIKWKEIFDFLEAATDRTEDVGNLLEGVVVKHG